MSTRSSERRKPSAPWGPFAELLTTYAEMTLAAAQTISHRSVLLNRAGINPNAAERREIIRMGVEKGEAATQSAQAMSDEWPGVNRHMAALLQRQAEIAKAWAAFASVRSLAELAVAQQRYWDAVSKGGEAAFRLWTAGVQTAQKGLQPIHARTTANARRLGPAGQHNGKRRSTRR